jgi:tetratricopeptide (TPR) repeat protein
MKSKDDIQYEAQSLLKIGKILRQFGKNDQSRKVLTLVLKNKDLKREDKLEALYEIGEIYLIQKDIQKALEIWEKILSVTSEYRDVKSKLEQYEKTKSNSMLRLYMMAPREDFIDLCQKIVSKFAKNVVIIRTEPQRDSTLEIFAQAVYHEVPTTIYFKFFRGTLNIGQLAIREFYEKLKESKAKQGVCITTAEYSEEALSFSEGRMIELLGQRQLLKILSRP